MTYLPRVADQELKDRLAYSGAVLIEGAKACGKTETAKQVARSQVLLDTEPQVVEALAADAELVLGGDTPRLIDEWQVEPTIWNHVRRAIDDRGKPGQFILTGSAVPADSTTRHTGAGRFARLRMRPMSFYETGFSAGSVSLAAMFDGDAVSGKSSTSGLQDVVEQIVRGGWPGARELSAIAGVAMARDYLDQTARLDVERVDGVRRDPRNVTATLKALARSTATEVSVSTLAADAGGPEGPLARATIGAYLDSLTRIFVLEDQPAWGPHLRSRSILRNAPKRHLVDPSLAVAALGGSSKTLLSDWNLLGQLFESLVVRDLRIYSQPLSGEVFHYRDSTGLEADAIIQTPAHGWGAIEVKLSPARIDEAAASLLRFAQRVDTSRMGEPSFLAVVTAFGISYRRADGVDVVAIDALGP
ncbi:MAG: ATP-binding protein [Thermoleophilaceae bacterium]|nr:ATP-binding protein [Thermoleophilaceae bacterium]